MLENPPECRREASVCSWPSDYQLLNFSWCGNLNMDPEYQLDAGTAAVAANLTAVAPAVVKFLVPVTTTHLPDVTYAPTDVSSTAQSAAPVPQIVETASRLWASGTTSTVPSTVPSGRLEELAGDLGKRIEDRLRQVQDSLQHINQSPAIVVVNPPAASPSPGWQHDVDAGTVGGAVAVLLCLLAVAVCIAVRRYKPDLWKAGKARIYGAVQVLALPASWLCGLAADAFRRLHHSAAGAQEDAPQEAGSRV